MKYLIWGVGLCSLLFTTGCSSSKSTVYESKWKQNSLFTLNGETDNADQRSRASYGVQNNEETLFVNFKTRETYLIKSIISNGVTLTFKPEGNKKNSGEILFPVVLKEDRRAIRKIENVDMLGPTMQMLLETFNKEAIWNEGTGEKFVNLINANEGINATIQMSVDGELSLTYEFTLSKLKVDLSKHQYLGMKLRVEEGGGRSGISPGVSIGMGTGGMGMGGMGVGFGSRSAYGGNQTYEVNLNVRLASK